MAKRIDMQTEHAGSFGFDHKDHLTNLEDRITAFEPQNHPLSKAKIDTEKKID